MSGPRAGVDFHGAGQGGFQSSTEIGAACGVGEGAGSLDTGDGRCGLSRQNIVQADRPHCSHVHSVTGDVEGRTGKRRAETTAGRGTEPALEGPPGRSAATGD